MKRPKSFIINLPRRRPYHRPRGPKLTVVEDSSPEPSPPANPRSTGVSPHLSPDLGFPSPKRPISPRPLTACSNPPPTETTCPDLPRSVPPAVLPDPPCDNPEECARLRHRVLPEYYYRRLPNYFYPNQTVFPPYRPICRSMGPDVGGGFEAAPSEQEPEEEQDLDGAEGAEKCPYMKMYGL